VGGRVKLVAVLMEKTSVPLGYVGWGVFSSRMDLKRNGWLLGRDEVNW